MRFLRQFATSLQRTPRIEGRSIVTCSQPVPRLAAAITAVVGIVVLLGWALDVDFLRRVTPGLVMMNPATAVAFILGGASLWLLQGEHSRLRSRRVGQVCAGIVALIGLLRLCALVGGPDMGVDQWLFVSKLDAGGGAGFPSRMAPNTAFNFLLLGGALLLLDVKTRRGVYPTQIFALAAALTALFAIIGYAYNAQTFYGIDGFIPMSLHAALCFLALAGGVLGARAHRGIVAIFTSPGLGGIVARRLLPTTILVPLVLGGLRLQGEIAGLYGMAFGVSLMVTMTIFVFMVLIGWTAAALERTDAERKQIAQELRVTAQQLAAANEANQRILDYSLDVICTIDEAGRFMQVSPACEKVWLYTPEELAGQKYIDFVCPEDVEPTNQMALNVVSGEATSNFENRYIRKDGAIVPMVWSVAEKTLFCVARDNSERKQAEEQLAAAAGRVANILESITEAFLAVDKDWRFTYVNDEAERLLMRSRDELLGHIQWEVFPEAVGTIFYERYHQAVASGTPVTFEEFYLPLNIWFEVHAFPSAEGLSVYFQDVTGRKQADAALRDREQKLQAILAASPDAISFVGADGMIKWTSQDTVKMIEGNAEAIGGQSLLETLPAIIHPDDLEEMTRQMQVMLAGEHEASLIRVRVATPQDRFTPVESSSRLVRDETGHVTGFVSVTRNVTEQVQLEESLETAKEQAERANAAKSEFLSRTSHELRTPLNAILGFAQLLEMDELEPGHRAGVEQILKGGRHLLELVNEVLDIASIDAGRMALSSEPVQLRALMQETMQMLQPLADEHRIRFENNLGAGYVMADQQRLKQVLLNLLSNAVKYNREGGLVRLSSGTAAIPGRVRFEVTDSGAGISSAGLEKLFSPFERLDAAEKGVEGTGIGLTISQRLVRLMDGEIGVYSVENEGTTFWVELPGAQGPVQALKHSEALAPIVAEKLASNATQHTVLYIEDNLSNLNLIEHILSRRPAVRLLSAMQGRRGLELAREQRPDLILLDLHLPDIQGDEVLQHLRAEAATQNVPVVMLSADATPRQAERLLEAGAKAYLTKPLDVKQFLQVLEENLQSKMPTPS